MTDSPTRPIEGGAAAKWRLGLLAGLVFLGDRLLWETTPGISLAIFAGFVATAAILALSKPVGGVRLSAAIGVAVLSILPVIELVQPLSVFIFFIGFAAFLLVLAGASVRGAVWVWFGAPFLSLADAMQSIENGLLRSVSSGQVMRNWGLPGLVGLVFVTLLIGANPVLESWVPDVSKIDLPQPLRAVFWMTLALFLWPCLVPARLGAWLAPRPRAIGPNRVPGIVNRASVLRSLLLFNLLFTAQNGMDLAFLSGGVRLPAGLSYAEYAHRGAYPLIVLALLSGAFAILFRPFSHGVPLIRWLLILWVVQTVWLTVSSGLRLELYVETYGLTRLRMAAGIWMALVASGLSLTFWQILRDHDARWLAVRSGGLGLGVLYLCCFISFDATIARYNLSRDVPQDAEYICGLEWAAKPAITELAPSLCAARPWATATAFQPLADWREWGFRWHRVSRSLAQLQTVPAGAIQ